MSSSNAKGTAEKHQQWRDSIATSQIIRRLNAHTNGTLIDDKTKQPTEMTASQIKAAEILLKKTLPDLKQVEHKGMGDGGALIVQVVRYGGGESYDHGTDL